MSIQRLENVGVVVEDLAVVTRFFVDLGLSVLIADMVEGAWVDRVVGIDGVRTEVAILQTRDGRGRLELMKFHSSPVRIGDQGAPPNTLGLRRLAFVVDDLDAAVAALQYRDIYRLCYVNGPEGIIVMLSEELHPGYGLG